MRGGGVRGGSRGGSRIGNRGGRGGRKKGSESVGKRPRSPGTTPSKVKEPKWTDDIFGPLDNRMKTAIDFINEDSDFESLGSDMDMEGEGEDEFETNHNGNEDQESTNMEDDIIRRLENLGSITVNAWIKRMEKEEVH
jgi:hypothetical protein